MIASMYERRMKVASVISAIVFLIGGITLLMAWPHSTEDWLNVILIVLIGFTMLSIAISSRIKYRRVKNMDAPEATVSLLELDHLVLKKDVTFFPCLLLFTKHGHFVGTVKPKRPPFLLYPFSIFLSDPLLMMLPLSYGLFSSDGTMLFSFQRKGIKQSTVSIFDTKGKKVGEYVQEDFKSLVNIKGELKDKSGSTLLSVEMNGFSGDFSWEDEENRKWAYFYDGYFPHEYTTLFRDTDNDIVNLASDLSKENKTLLLGAICFIFLERKR